MVAYLLFVAVVAVATYLAVRAILERGPRRSRASRTRVHQPEQRPWAPDDDDEFLAELDRRRRPGD